MPFRAPASKAGGQASGGGCAGPISGTGPSRGDDVLLRRGAVPAISPVALRREPGLAGELLPALLAAGKVGQESVDVKEPRLEIAGQGPDVPARGETPQDREQEAVEDVVGAPPGENSSMSSAK